MKNKKLLTRLFALLASLVLVFALALPCFAEETEQPPTDYIYIRVYSFEQLVSLVVTRISYPCIVRENLESSQLFYGDVRYDSTYVYIVADYCFPDVVSHYQFTLSSSDVVSVDAIDHFFDGTSDQYSYSIAWDDLELYVLVPASSTPLDPTTPSSDMYSNLFNILKDAVYGSDAELTGSQEYALTLISTILTYATILLPVILVIFIAVWCFKRF